MKNIKHYIFYTVLIAGICFLLVSLFESKKQIAAAEKADKKTADKIKTEAKEIERQVNENGIESVLFDIEPNKATQEEAASMKGSKNLLDTTAVALDVKTRQLKQVMVINSTLEAENLLLKRKLDATSRPYYTYSGNGLDLKFTPPNDIDTNARAEFSANVNIKATQYWKRNWFLGAKKSILAVTSDNPMFKINGADFVEIEQQQPTFGLRVQASTSYNFDTGTVGFGPALRFDAGRFSFQGRYSKFPNDPKWKPSVNASFDLLRF